MAISDIQTIPIESLKIDPKNARVHPEENIEAIKNSLKKFGQVLPLVVRRDTVVGGNGTLQAMRELDFAKVKVVYFKGSEIDAQALAIALNRSAELASWDTKTLGEILIDLADHGWPLEEIGFSESELEILFPAEEAEFRVDAPELKESEKNQKTTIIQYAMIFDTELQHRRFMKFLGWLKNEFTRQESVAARFDSFIRKVGQGGEWSFTLDQKEDE